MSVEDFRASVDRIMIGSWKVGEKPAAFDYTFLDADGLAIAIAPGWTGKLQWVTTADVDGDGNPILHSVDLVIDSNQDEGSSTRGRVTYQWAAGDLDPAGVYDGEAWVGNGTIRIASVDLGWVVRAALTPAPAV